MITKSEPNTPTSLLEMTIARCPGGGFAVFTRQDEANAFVAGRSAIPTASFSELTAALKFIESRMDDTEEATRG